MTTFTIELAGCTLQVNSLFASTRDYCRDYLTEKEPEFFITITPEDLAFQQAQAYREAREEGLKPRVFSDPFLERTAIQQKAADLLLSRDILLLHGSTVAVDGKAYLFTGACRSGKSTHTRLWRQVFGDRAVMVNDDKPFLTLSADPVLVSGSPWMGKHGIGCNVTLPLKGICLLEKGPANEIRPASIEELLPVLLHQSSQPLAEDLFPRLCRLTEAVARRVPLYHMHCTKDPEAAVIAHRLMSAD